MRRELIQRSRTGTEVLGHDLNGVRQHYGGRDDATKFLAVPPLLYLTSRRADPNVIC